MGPGLGNCLGLLFSLVDLRGESFPLVSFLGVKKGVKGAYKEKGGGTEGPGEGLTGENGEGAREKN